MTYGAKLLHVMMHKRRADRKSCSKEKHYSEELYNCDECEKEICENCDFCQTEDQRNLCFECKYNKEMGGNVLYFIDK